MSPMSLMVERLFVGVRGLFQSFAAACKYMYKEINKNNGKGDKRE